MFCVNAPTKPTQAYFTVFLSCCRQMQKYCLKLGQYRFLLDHFQQLHMFYVNETVVIYLQTTNPSEYVMCFVFLKRALMD